MKDQKNALQCQLVDDCKKRTDRLSDWENGFIESIEEQMLKGLELSKKQDDRLSIVWEKATERG